MADYNVNMKQWNGSSFDNVLPLAFNSKALEGKSYDDIIQYVQSLLGTGGNNCRIFYGYYVGDGKYGANNPNTLEFGFTPMYVIISRNSQDAYYAKYGYSSLYWSSNRSNELTWDNTSIQWYYAGTDSTYDRSAIQLNANGVYYKYIAFGY